jgi:2-polyprenyl-3-methyl-5-hydroxy-6-metoxy-1,4-benzoquinol methylase
MRNLATEGNGLMSELDQEKAEAFAGTMMGILNGGMLSLMTSIGHETGLFDAMADLPPSTSEEIAHAAGLNERYVREWLAAMVTGQIVEHAPAEGTHLLPPEHALFLTRASGPDNMAVFARLIPALSEVYNGIVHSFRDGGGVPYDQHNTTLTCFAGYTAQVFDQSLISKVIPLMPEVESALKDGIEVLEIGCGTGHSTNVMAAAFPDSRFTGYDFREVALEQARAEAQSKGLGNVDFRKQDLVDMADVDAFDLVTAFDVIHDQAQPRQVLRHIVTALRPGGTYLMVDIKAATDVQDNMQHPMAPFLYTSSTMHCLTVSLAQGGEGLGAMWGEQKAIELLGEAGFEDITVNEVEGDVFNNYYIATSP